MIAMCGVQHKDRKRSTYLMFLLGLNETIDQLVWSCDKEKGWSCLEKGIRF